MNLNSKNDNCEKYVGSKEILECDKCKIGDILNEDNFFVKQNYKVGEKEKFLIANVKKEKKKIYINIMKDNIYLILIKIKLNTKIALLKIVYHVIIIMGTEKNEKNFLSLY